MTAAATTPIPIPTAGPQRPGMIIVFGGTFDPPHNGHIDLPARARDEIERAESCPGHAWLLYVPAARSPLKTGAPAASDADRVQMLRLALADSGLARAAIWTDEIDRAPAEPSYTVETLSRARRWLDAQGLSDVPLRLLIGADQAASFHRWREPHTILRLARPAVMVRGGISDADTLSQTLSAAGFWDSREMAVWRDSVVPMGRVDVSASRLRQALAGHDQSEADRWLAPGVAAYIRAHALYRGGTAHAPGRE